MRKPSVRKKVRRLNTVEITKFLVTKSPISEENLLLMKVLSFYKHPYLVLGQGKYDRKGNPLLKNPCYIHFQTPEDLLVLKEKIGKMIDVIYVDIKKKPEFNPDNF